METAKVDILKLQQLNDRINQCLDALSQVRSSVHGLSHSSAPSVAGNPTGSWGQPGITPYGPAMANAPTGFGLSHSSYGQGIGGYPPAVSGIQGQQQQGGFGSPQGMYGQQPIGLAAQQGIQPFGWVPTGGLSHSGPERGPEREAFRPLASDPSLASRIAQTFPFAQQQVPPVTFIP